KQEVERWRQRDPILVLERRLREAGALDDEAVREVEAWAEKRVQEAVSFAESSPEPPPEELYRDVYGA
ncbi:MAG: thiamine pyrophosphate-dependent enzyme, partial [Armatimonadota bacterium]|nr:thiamine pyrophosphate-dependent enzyme [Armatimonadota bacterium]